MFDINQKEIERFGDQGVRLGAALGFYVVASKYLDGSVNKTMKWTMNYDTFGPLIKCSLLSIVPVGCGLFGRKLFEGFYRRKMEN